MAAVRAMTDCPSEETLAAFLDGRLDPEARSRVLEHLADCGEDREVVYAGEEMGRLRVAEGEVGVDPKVVPIRSWRRPTLVSLAAVVAAGFGVVLLPLLQSRPSGKEELIEATERLDYRTVQGRISGEFPYKPLRGVPRGSSEEQSLAQLKLISVAGVIEHEARDHPSVASKQALGAALVLLGQHDRAISVLHSALSLHTKRSDVTKGIDVATDPELLNDLSVAYLARGRYKDQPEDYLIASEAALKSFEIAHTPEAAWNRALALEALELREQALQAWRHYLEVDPASLWSTEARQRIQRLNVATDTDLWHSSRAALQRASLQHDQEEVERIVARFPQHSRMWCEEIVLVEWARLRDSDSAAAEKQLAIVEAVGAALRTDRMLIDTAAHLRQTIKFGAGSLRTLQSGFIAYGRARPAYRESRIGDAAQQFEKSALLLEEGGSPFALMPRMFLAACAYYGNNFEGAERKISALAELPDVVRRFPVLRAQLLWVRGLSQLQKGLPQGAALQFRASLASFSEAHETDNMTAMHELLSECLLYVGEDREAFRHRSMALRLLAESGRASYRRMQLMISTARAALRLNAHRTALLCLNSNVSFGKPDSSTMELWVNTLLWRSNIEQTGGAFDAAKADLEEAIALSLQIPDPDVRAYSTNTTEFVVHRLAATSDRSKRRALIDDAVRFAENSGDGYRLAQLRLMQARESISSNAPEAAESSLLAALSIVERQRGFLSDEELRSSFLGEEQQIFDQLISLYWNRGDADRSFAIAERARARTLLDRLAGRIEANPIALRDLMAVLPARVVVIQFTTTAEVMMTWAITSTSVHLTEQPIRRDEITRTCERFIDAVRGTNTKDFDVLARHLYDLLVKPAAPHTGDTIIFVPDTRMPNVPYAALIDARNSELLIVDHTITVSPSASMLMRTLQLSQSRRVAGQEVLLVAPRSQREGQDLPILPAARLEVDRIARCYPRPQILSGASATKKAFLEAATTADLIHFAGHSLLGTRASLSRLLFSGRGEVESSLFAEEIQRLSLLRAPVVVLSACDSASDVGYDRQGVSNLSRAFLAAGASVVIGSMWPVDDEATAELLTRFHVGLAAGTDPAEAMRSAQLALSNSDDRTWAAFAVMGGSLK